jgi:cytochrome c oxidase subunit 3
MATTRATPPTTSSTARTGVWVGIAAISMSFAAYTSAMVVRQGASADWQHFRLPPILYFNTMLLLASSATLELGRRRLAAIRERDDVLVLHPSPADGPIWLNLTLALGLLFLVGQVLAWRALAAAGLYLATSPSSAFFYVFTALHGVHLIGGLAALAYLLRRLRHPTARLQGALAATSLYWHFMAVLWLYLLLLLALRLQ